MLRELHISNLAVIADARIELVSGLNCFTGATGAGKSLVIGAIELLLGLRIASDMLRAGADEGRVSGLFELRDPRVIRRIEQQTDVPLSDSGGELLLTRRLHASGRTSVSLNGHPITLAMLKNVAEALVDVHGQHDQQFLLKPSNQLDVLDEYAGLTASREAYYGVYQRLNESRAQIEELRAGRTLRAQQLELYRFQAEEIDAAEVQPGEFEELKSRATVLENVGKLKKDASAAHSALYEAEGSVMERLKMIAAVLSESAALDSNLKSVADVVRDATIQLEDASFDLGRYLDKLDLDPAELAEVNERLNIINRLLNKYGQTIEEVLSYRAQLDSQIRELERATDNLAALEQAIEPLTREVQEISKSLRAARSAAAATLAPLIERQFAELGMERAKLRIDLHPLRDPGPSGADELEFIVQTNPGLPAQPLRKIASGGEISRIMLALKAVLAGGDRVSVLVFDEIDSNVGGRLGSVIGQKLRELSHHHQVLCITHLPQIASFADRHLTVRKQSRGGETITTVKTIDGAERIEELAEMIGGQKITDITRAQARELLAAPKDLERPAPSRGKRSKTVKT